MHRFMGNGQWPGHLLKGSKEKDWIISNKEVRDISMRIGSRE